MLRFRNYRNNLRQDTQFLLIISVLGVVVPLLGCLYWHWHTILLAHPHCPVQHLHFFLVPSLSGGCIEAMSIYLYIIQYCCTQLSKWLSSDRCCHSTSIPAEQISNTYSTLTPQYGDRNGTLLIQWKTSHHQPASQVCLIISCRLPWCAVVYSHCPMAPGVIGQHHSCGWKSEYTEKRTE